MTDLSTCVVIAAYTEDRWEPMSRSLRSLAAQTHRPDQVVVGIDHNDALLERVRSTFPEVDVVSNGHERGASGSRNTALEKARGDIIAFLDDDAVPERDWLEKIARHYEDDRVLGVGGFLDPAWPGDEGPGWMPEEFLWVVGCSYKGLPEEAGEVRNLIGANMSLRRSVFERVGGFRSDISRVGKRPFGLEETDLCVRALLATPDGRFVHEPAAVAHHEVTSARVKPSYFFTHCYDEGRAKGILSSEVGSDQGLSAERRQALVVLPAGVLRGVRDALRGDLDGLLRAGAIVGGLVCAAVGLVHETARRRIAGAPEPPPPVPIPRPDSVRA